MGVQPLGDLDLHSQNLLRTERCKRGPNPERGFVQIDLIIQVQPKGQGHFIEQQILRRQRGVAGQLVVGSVIGVHIAVQAFEGVGHAVDIHHARLRAQPVDKLLGLGQECRVTDAVAVPGL